MALRYRYVYSNRRLEVKATSACSHGQLNFSTEFRTSTTKGSLGFQQPASYDYAAGSNYFEKNLTWGVRPLRSTSVRSSLLFATSPGTISVISSARKSHEHALP
ncbi:hypothetical protein MFFC18_03580 [Mariniblastus fucicola]|uniref:Uncharacterized protein n=1 Tax=Mariniblastus fucicola TaxID=980251 RepID=A0A5B9P4V1_9BACT|nr:hypothetical protein MFFC18_03580 [Mariniblastus fucicola]